ncbi:MAG: DUF3300 domain-containing protein, partial [Tepidisphaeraceae bacterium]
MQPAAAVSTPAPSADKLSLADLETLLGPVALYPDSLLANVFAAAVYPQEIAAAGAYVKGHGDSAKIAQQGWEPGVQAIAAVPDVLALLADNPDWTGAIGQAYLTQAQDVMTAVQSLRAKAKNNGVLKSNQQMTVVESGSTIIIESPQPNVVYVPTYDPAVVYVDHGPSSGEVFAAGVIGFGVGLAVGAAFNDYDCDWHGGCVGWGYHGGGYHDVDIDIDRDININTGDINVDRSRTNVSGNRIGNEGAKFEPNVTKVNQARASGALSSTKTNQFRGAGAGGVGGARSSPAAAKVPRSSNVASA